MLALDLKKLSDAHPFTERELIILAFIAIIPLTILFFVNYIMSQLSDCLMQMLDSLETVVG